MEAKDKVLSAVKSAMEQSVWLRHSAHASLMSQIKSLSMSQPLSDNDKARYCYLVIAADAIEAMFPDEQWSSAEDLLVRSGHQLRESGL